MEVINNSNDIANLKNNTLIGEPELINSKIQFGGINNILVCEGNIRLNNANISFKGSNSIIYISYSELDFRLKLFIRNNSTIYIGKNNKMGSGEIHVEEHQNVIIGDDCMFGGGVKMSTCDAYPIYELKTKQRVNFSESIFIGDHVWINQNSYISKGSKIGSGSIIGVNSFLPSYSKVHSNCLVLGNPIQLIRNDVFFTKDFLGSCTAQDTLNFSTYKSDIYKYEYVNRETLSFEKVDEILKELNVDDRLTFIKKLFVKNKFKNRFYY